MGEQQGEIAVHLLERCQQPFAAFTVQPGNAAAQGADRFVKIGLFADQQVMLGLHLARIFLGAQVHGAQGIALAFQTVYFGLDLLRRGHRTCIGTQRLQQRSWRLAQRLFDAHCGFGHGGHRRLGPRFGPGAGFARCTRRAFAITRCNHRLSLGGLGPGQRIPCRGAPSGRVLEPLIQFGPPDCDVLRCATGPGQIGPRRRQPRVELGHPFARSVQPAAPAGQILLHSLRPARPALALAAQLVMGRAALHHRHARRLDRHLDVIQPRAQRRQIVQPRNCRLGLVYAAACRHRLFVMARHGQTRAFQLACRNVAIRLCPAQRAIGLGNLSIRRASGFAHLTVGPGQRLKPLLQRVMGRGCAVCPGRHPLHLLGQCLQPVPLLQPQRRRRGRIFGPGAKPVPAP